jgi:hypothetical protein
MNLIHSKQMACGDAADIRRWIVDGIHSNCRRMFVKFGDAEFLALNRHTGISCSGDVYTADVAVALEKALAYFAACPDCILSKWPDSDPWSKLRKKFADPLNPRYGDIYTMLITKENIHELHAFWTCIKDSEKRIVYIASDLMAPMAAWLGAQHIVIPRTNSFGKLDDIDVDADICLISGGLAAKPLLHKLAVAHPNMHILDVGSGFDSLCVGFTRTGQPDSTYARTVFKL